MKAILLAAGYGSRLWPLTKNTPKCLIPIHGKPLLRYWIELFEKYKITDVVINTHYLSDQIYEYIKENPGQINWSIAYEPILLGSGGTLLSLKYFTPEEPVLVCNADNFSNVNLKELIKFHKQKKGLLTMALMDPPEDISACGIATLNTNNLIVDFQEKPEIIQLSPAQGVNAGIYIIEPQVFQYIPEDRPVDFSSEVLNNIPNKYGMFINGFCKDIGTLQAYKEIEEWNHE